jgi:hypothetical protein
LLPSDFSTRCVYKIECEVPGSLVYGSRVRLLHSATGSKIVASEIIDDAIHFDIKPKEDPLTQTEILASTIVKRRNSLKAPETQLNCAFLRNVGDKYPNYEDIWIVVSRYKLREEGEQVYSVCITTIICTILILLL